MKTLSCAYAALARLSTQDTRAEQKLQEHSGRPSPFPVAGATEKSAETALSKKLFQWSGFYSKIGSAGEIFFTLIISLDTRVPSGSKDDGKERGTNKMQRLRLILQGQDSRYRQTRQLQV
jgi:hypothetical protein